MAGLGNGLVIAPNQDLVLGSAGSGSTAKVMPSLLHSGQTATVVNLCFIAAAFLCALALPSRLAHQQGERLSGNGQAVTGNELIAAERRKRWTSRGARCTQPPRHQC